MFYKVMKNNRVIDVLDHVTYLRYQPKNKIMVLSDISQAQAILSSDKNTIWHERTLYKMPVDGYDTVSLVPIDEYEYKTLKALNGKTPEEIADGVILSLIENGVI
jgi:hypothetical protein